MCEAVDNLPYERDQRGQCVRCTQRDPRRGRHTRGGSEALSKAIGCLVSLFCKPPERGL